MSNPKKQHQSKPSFKTRLSSAWNNAIDDTAAVETAITSGVGTLIEAPFKPVIDDVEKGLVILAIGAGVLIYFNRENLKVVGSDVYSQIKTSGRRLVNTGEEVLPYAAAGALLL